MSGQAGTSLATMLRRTFGLLVLLVAVVGGSGVAAMSASASRVEHLSTVLTPAVEANATTLSLMLDAETGVRGYLLTGDGDLLQPYERAREQLPEQLDTARQLAQRSGLGAGFQTDVDEVANAAGAWMDRYAEPAVARGPVNGRGVDPLAPSTIRGKSTFDTFRQHQQEVAEALVAQRAEVRAESRWLREAGVPLLVLLAITCVLVAALIARRSIGSVENPLRQLRDVLERLRLGDSTARVLGSGPAEVRDVGAAVNALADEGNRLRAEQHEASRMRRTARDAARRVREELGREAVLQAAARELGESLELDRVWLVELARSADDGSQEHQVHWRRADSGSAGSRLPALPAAALTRVGQLWREGDVLAVPDTSSTDVLEIGSAERMRLVDATGAGALVVAPVGGNDDVIAVAVLVADEPRELGEELLGAVQWICADLGRALEHSRLFEQQLALVDRLQELDRRKTDFLSTVSHELRTPLTSIAGYAELLREGDAGPVTPQMAGMLEVIERNTVRLRALIEDLLTLSRIESGSYGGATTDVHLDDLVHAAVRSLAPAAERSQLELDVRHTADSAVVSGDEMQLERVLLNLLSNAVKFTPPGGRVLVEVREGVTPDELQLRVSDSGIGIPVEEQDQMFSRFFRASNAVAGAVPGTGLGLSIVRGIVTEHHGRLELTSAAGEGTEVVVTLPRVRESQHVG